jgi:signal-transduction protein with cAMP-binding, CBS, and nucleotidyltransferase domain
LKKLLKIQREKLVENMTISNHKKDEVIWKKDKPVDILFIVVEGILKKASNEKVCAAKGAFLGDFYLKGSNIGGKYDDDIAMETDGVLAQLSF